MIAIQGKSVAELREIAKVLGITEEKLSKKELIARIVAFGTGEAATEAPTEEPAEVAAPAPQKRKRARLGSVKVEAAKPVAEIEKPAAPAEIAEEPAKVEAPAEEVKAEEPTPQPKK